MKAKIYDNIFFTRIDIKFKSRNFVKKNIYKNKYLFIEIINNTEINNSKKIIYDNIMQDFLKTLDENKLLNFRKINADLVIDFVKKFQNQKVKICLFAYYKHYSFLYHYLKYLGYDVYFVNL